MKRTFTDVKFFFILFVAIGLISQSALADESSNVNWEAFSKNLTIALKSSNVGLRNSAMRSVIRHGEHLQVKDATFDVMRVFRNSDDQKVRQLALVTLTKMKSDWAIAFLKRHLRFEKNPAIKHQLIAILLDNLEYPSAPEDLALLLD